MTAGPGTGRTDHHHGGDDESADRAPVSLVTVVALPARAAGRALLVLRRQLLAGLDQPGGLVVDGSQVAQLSPAAQAVLVASRRTARLRGVDWRLREPTAAMVFALRGSGLSHLLVPLPGRPGPSARPAPAASSGSAEDAGPQPASPATTDRRAPATPPSATCQPAPAGGTSR